MNMRTREEAASLLFCLIYFFAENLQVDARERPNIVVVLADDLGIGDVGCFGNDTIRTPNIDSICRDGAKLTHHLVAAPVCTPSRAALLTGRYPKRIGIVSEADTPIHIPPVLFYTASKGGLPPEEVTFAEVAKSRGYKTGHLGKWHLGLHCDGHDFCHSPLNQGFDYTWGFPLTNMKDFGDDIPLMWHSPVQGRTMVKVIIAGVVMAASALLAWKFGFIGCVASVLLSLAAVAFVAIFYLLMDLKFWNSMILRNRIVVERPIELDSLSARFDAETKRFISSASREPRPFLLFLSFAHAHTALHALPQNRGKSRHGRYGDAVEELDASIGVLLESLRENGVLDDTLLYFSSDHGGHQEEVTWNAEAAGGWNGIFKGGKFQTFEGGIRVPTALMWPKVIAGGSEVTAMTSNMDVMATILDLLEVEDHLPKIDGKSLLPLVGGKGNEETKAQLDDPQAQIQDEPNDATAPHHNKPNSLVSPRHMTHDLLLHHCDYLLNSATYAPDGPSGSIWKVHWRIPTWIPGTDVCHFRCDCFNNHRDLDEPLLYDLASDPGEASPLLGVDSRRIVANVEARAKRVEAAMGQAMPQMTLTRVVLQIHLMPFCPKFPFLFCRDGTHKDTYLS